MGEFSGALYVFRRDGLGWVEEAKLHGEGVEAGDRFGATCDVDGDRIVVGPWTQYARRGDAGAAYVFRRGEVWVQEARVVPDRFVPNDSFGQCVRISGDTLVVAAPADDVGRSNRGAFYVFRSVLGQWTQVRKVLGPLVPIDDGEFGWALAFDGVNIVSGAPGHRIPPHHWNGAALSFRLDCFELRVEGACPGEVLASWTGATPDRPLTLVFGTLPGGTIIPGGVCQGTRLDVAGRVVRVGTIDSGNGSGSVNGQVGSGACGGYLQLIAGGSCETSNPCQIPN